ncbi:hypothetical protein DNTS_012031 [Danionella cerebrum]|uniref:Carbohydrate kinase FGGY N-terminal domain-containing protein n=1 Tax=Danionella cerebrum TaxID=2873325 RepID=A0A553MX40_9TELE|nr:hypothetical protein DNTS_012031 [Danionella translucida]
MEVCVCVCVCVRACVCVCVCQRVTRGIDVQYVRGIGFDATCSLVVLDQNFKPVPVNQSGVCERNVVMWMDHRAVDQASRITETGHSVLDSFGGIMSPEMQPPKLLWLKENLPQLCWKSATHFFDLPDFLSWKATGSLSRSSYLSLCTVVCKWTYSASSGWDDTFWTQIGLEDLKENNYSRIGQQVCVPGSPLGSGLTEEAAADLGLPQGTAVGASLIDAHAGAIGIARSCLIDSQGFSLGGAHLYTCGIFHEVEVQHRLLGADISGLHLPCEKQPISSRMALICGTSSCHMAVSQQPVSVPGVWGPYLSALLPGLWLIEGGQSATGRLLDHMVKGHAAYGQLKQEAEQSGQHVYSYLNLHLENMAAAMEETHLDQLTAHLHVWPDFHGNRSPLADPMTRGLVEMLGYMMLPWMRREVSLSVQTTVWGEGDLL